MSANNDRGATATAPPINGTSNPFLDLWLHYFEQSGAQSKAIFEGLQAVGDPRAMHQKWLEALAESLDSFMRTPAFLEAMKNNLKVVTDMKRMQDQAIEDAARHVGAPLASDIHGLFERLNGVEQAILARLAAIEARLDALGPPRRRGSGA